MQFDLLIRGGSIIDGSGAPLLPADIGIVDDTIHAIRASKSDPEISCRVAGCGKAKAF